MGVDNQGTDSNYTWVPIEQSMYFAAEYKYSLAIEGNNQNLGVGCKPVETDLEGNSRLGVKRAAGKWDPAEPDKLGAQAGLVVVYNRSAAEQG